ncbi:flagellar export protein FliJ [Bacillus xiapuensis]|uniref:Flagellar FliJ protein n=1 Tax=Bacillus xiapuensis TaxID=2014075 RepID=A0ABU6NDY1_9BACI|nr:flagellar FliJ family protein [Bacillus xiapuensis]
MKFEFSFQKILDFKEKEKEKAKKEFGSAKLRQLELQEKMEGLELEKEKIFNHYNEVNRKTVWEIVELQNEIDHVDLQMKRLKDQSRQIHQEVELNHQILIEKTKEAKTWNQWKEKSKAAFQKQLDREEQAMLDEMAVLRYSRRV